MNLYEWKSFRYHEHNAKYMKQRCMEERDVCVKDFIYIIIYIYLYFFIYILFSLSLPASGWWRYNFEAIAGKFTKAIRVLCQSSIVWKVFGPSGYSWESINTKYYQRTPTLAMFSSKREIQFAMYTQSLMLACSISAVILDNDRSNAIIDSEHVSVLRYQISRTLA